MGRFSRLKRDKKDKNEGPESVSSPSGSWSDKKGSIVLPPALSERDAQAPNLVLSHAAAIARARGNASRSLLKKEESRQKAGTSAVSDIRDLGTELGLVADDFANVLETLSEADAEAASSSRSNRKKAKKAKKSKKSKRRRAASLGSADPEALKQLSFENTAANSAAALRLHSVLFTKLADARKELDELVEDDLAASLRVSIQRDIKGASDAEKRFDRATKALEDADRQLQKQMASKDIKLDKVGEAEAVRDDARRELESTTGRELKVIANANANIQAESVVRGVNLLDAHAQFFESGLLALLELRPEIDRLRDALADIEDK